jgi:hypothetical protein
MGMGRGIALAALVAALITPTAAEAKQTLVPWPSDHWTTRDKTTDTGRRLNLPLALMPVNKNGVHIDPTDMNRADGFSPGSMAIVKVPGLDTPGALVASDLPGLDDLRASLWPNSPVVVFNARTGQRVPVWAELDSNATTNAARMLLIRPAKNYTEGQRYVVVLRNLKRQDGSAIDPVKNGVEPGLGGELRRAGIVRKGLYRAWSFTVASARSLAGRMLHIRDDAFAQLGDHNLSDLKVEGQSPQFTIDKVTNLTAAQDSDIARQVDGTMTVPCYLTMACAPGGQFTFDANGLPQQHGTTTATFTCRIPRSALDPANPPQARPSLYGHGLLGDPDEVNAGNVRDMANEHNFVFCATAWAGFASGDIGNVVAAINDFSHFNTVADRMQQGFLNQLYLGRLMIHPNGLSSNAAFQKNGKSVIDTRRLFYDGNSQGGIMGGGLTAVAPDFNRAALGVPGMNYSTLLQRSVDFDTYSQLIYPSYPVESSRQLMLAVIQLLWDRGEADGYAQHITTDALPNTPQHTVLMHVAFGDHQVSDTTAEVEARTIGARGYFPVLDPGRSPWTRFQMIQPIPKFPFGGSAIVMWDAGTPAPPITNTPNRGGSDPHSRPRSTPAARTQKSEFLQINGSVVDVCGGKACHAVP